MSDMKNVKAGSNSHGFCKDIKGKKEIPKGSICFILKGIVIQ
jgi:hypothetical protein